MFRCLRWRFGRCDTLSPRPERLSRSLSYLSGASAERVSVPRRGNGNVTLDIFHPVTAPPGQDGALGVVLYLPRGPIWPNEEHESSTISLLRSTLPFHIVQVNYRFDYDYKFPVPIHDVLAGYDWVTEHLLPKGPGGRRRRVAACGELLGGGLAASLALTECRVGEAGVAGAAVNNAVLNWVGSEPASAHEKRVGPKDSSAAGIEIEESSVMEQLGSLRSRLFGKPEHYFDPFASPILFFRSPGEEIPPAPKAAPTDDMDVLSMLERESFYQEQLSLSLAMAENSAPQPLEEDIGPTKKRKVSRRFPSPTSGLRLAPFHISAGIESALSEQAAELAHVLRQSFVRTSKQAKGDFGRKVWMDDEAAFMDEDELNEKQRLDQASERMAALDFSQGLGLWDDSPEGRARVLTVAQWLHERLTH